MSNQTQQHDQQAGQAFSQDEFSALLNKEFRPKTDQARSAVESAVKTLAQQALEKSGSFMLPALYAGLHAPARRIYREEAAGYLQLAAAPAEGLTRLLSPARMQLLYSSLQVQPDGTPAALLLTEECTRLTVAVQLLPPFVWEDPLPPLPDVPAALTLQLTMQDVVAIDTAPAALAHKLVHSTDGKRWLHHPKAETFLSERLALLQRVYK
mgnify:FL=1